MSGVPDEIVLSRDRDLAGRDRELWIRRVLFAFAPLIAILAIFNAFGQRPQDNTVTTSVASLRLHAPD